MKITFRNTLRDIMEVLELSENDNGEICKKEFSARGKESIVPVKAGDGRVLIFPSNKNLKDYDIKKELVFNPIDEDPRGSDTECYKMFMKLCSNSVKAHFTELGAHILNSIKTLDSCKNKQLIRFASKLADISSEHSLKKPVTDDTRKLFSKFVVACNEGDISLISIVSKRPYELKGATYNRGVVVTFPIYTAMKEAYDEKVHEYEFNGVKVAKFQLEIFMAVFELLIDNLDDDVIAFTSNDNNYPSFIAMMKTFNALMEPMLKVYKEIKETIPGGTVLNFDLTLMSENTMNKLSELSAELDLLPKEKVEINTPANSRRNEDNEVITAPVIGNVRQEPVQEKVLPYGQPRRTPELTPRNQVVEDVDPFKAALYGGKVQQTSSKFPIQDIEQRYPSSRLVQDNRVNSNPFSMGSRVTFPHQNQNRFTSNGFMNRGGVRF